MRQALMGCYAPLIITLACAFVYQAIGQGLDPPGRLGVSPADAEKCDGYKRKDFQQLLHSAYKLSTASNVLSQPVLAAAQPPSAQDAKDCAIGSTWNQLEMQLHAALSPETYATDDRRHNPLRSSFFPTVRDQVKYLWQRPAHCSSLQLSPKLPQCQLSVGLSHLSALC
jgi:hypothetical protein